MLGDLKDNFPKSAEGKQRDYLNRTTEPQVYASVNQGKKVLKRIAKLKSYADQVRPNRRDVNVRRTKRRAGAE